MKWAQLLSELNARSVQLSASEDELIIRAPEGSLSPELWEHIAQYKSSLLKLLRDDSEEKQDGKAVQVIPQISERFKPFPLTPIQQAYWLGRNPSFELGRVGIHVYEELDCRNLDLTRLNQAWQRTLKRHEMLRVVVLPDGQQQILPDAEYSIEIVDFRSLESDEQKIGLEKLRQRLVQRVYDPLQFPLFTICACRLNETETRLFISIDALHVDMGSFAIVFGEWSELYENPAKQLPPLTLSYRDYALTVEGLRRQESFRQAQSYWQSRAAQLPPPPALPYSRAFSEITQQTFARRTGRLEQAQWQKLKRRAAAAGVTPSGITLSAMVEVLARWSQEQRFTLSVTLFNRLPIHPEVNKIVGDFTSMIPLPVDCQADGASFAERAASWQKLVWEGLDHRIVSGIEVLREFKRSQQQTQLGQLNLPVVFTSTLNLSQQGVLPLKKFGERIFNRIQTPQVSLDLQVYEEDGDLIFNWDGVKELFPAETLDQMFDAYRSLLEKLADETDIWHDLHGEIVSVPQSESRLLLNQTAKPLSPKVLPELFAIQAEKMADYPAVISSRLNLTYEQLSRLTNRIGRKIRATESAGLIAVVMEKGWEQVAAVWGILKGNCAYLPIDSTVPKERLLALLNEADVKTILTQPWLASELENLDGFQVQVISVDACNDFDDAPLDYTMQRPEDLAYVLYTSGSTGSPKGVMIEQRSVVNRMTDVIERFGVKPEDKVLALTALHHDLSVFDVIGALLAGATVVMPEESIHKDPRGWANLVAEHDITIWNSVPAFFEMLVESLGSDESEAKQKFASIRLVLLAGDWIPLNLPTRWLKINEKSEFISLGGPTETTVWDICYPIKTIDSEWRSIPYGSPMTNAEYFILNDKLELCPEWVVGELCIGGAGLARGYWKDEQKNAEKFIIHPQTNQRLYRSGDLGRYLPDGYIEIIGRKDLQLKINGWRIEPGEIEETLKEFPAVKQALVLPFQKNNRNSALSACIVLEETELGENEKRTKSPSAAFPSEHVKESKLSESEQALFKLKRAGVRAELNNQTAINLQLSSKEGFDEKFYRRRSVRTFSEQAVTQTQLSELLSCLSALKSPEALTPKFLYPSAGNLQPVQCYVQIHDGRVQDLAAGTYYYHPENHSLIYLSAETTPLSCHLPHNVSICEQSAFSIYLIGELAAIEPLYGDLARDFCLLEAGAMTQLLMSEATEYELGLCPIGDLDFGSVRRLFQLNQSHTFLHCLAGGIPALTVRRKAVEFSANGNGLKDNEISIDARTHQTAELSLINELKEFLAGKLPVQLIPQHFLFLESLPLNANGKIDRRALSEMANQKFSNQQAKPISTSPKNDFERKLAEICREVLEIDEVGVETNFGEMGADSIHLIQILSRLQGTIKREATITDLFRYPNIRALAAFFETAETDERSLLSRSEQRAVMRNEMRSRRKV